MQYGKSCFAGLRCLIENIIFDGFVKSPEVALRFILRRCGVRPSMPYSSGIVCLACGSVYEAVEFGRLFDFLRVHHF
jgi:hypothetical protein